MYNRYTYPLQPCRHLTLKLLKVIHGVPKYPTQRTLKVPTSPLLLVIEVCNVKPTYRKPCCESSDVVRLDLGPLLQCLQCETKLYEIMGWESYDVVTFDLGPLLQGQTKTAKLKNAYNFRNLQPLSFIIASTCLLCSGIHRRLAIKQAA